MNRNVEAFKKYYINATKEEVIEDMFKDNCYYIETIDNAIDILKEHNQNLDYEPWSIYKIKGSILFRLVNELAGIPDVKTNKENN